jgi:hypothetical protein
METKEKLLRSWPIIKWLDDARWSKGASKSLIPGHVFQSLNPSGKILNHWLSYITDQQRPWQDVWMMGGPIFAEILEQYESSTRADYALDLPLEFTSINIEKKVDIFSSKKQKIEGEKITYTPRYGSHMVSIARSLYILADFEGNIITYLSSNTPFIFRTSSVQADSSILRMAFLYYLLSYDNIHTGMTSFHRQRQEFQNDLEQRRKYIDKFLQSSNQLENTYYKWIRHRFHKRLWASFRDYVKPGSYHEPVFIEALKQAKADSIVDLLEQQRKQVLCALELPGDTWNLVFNQRLFDSKINHPASLRQYYNRLCTGGLLSDDFYPEQFDISFDFAPRMCDLDEQLLCPFKKSSKLKNYCFENTGKGKLCPIIKILCGYEVECVQTGCPVLGNAIDDICRGCPANIE